MAQYSANNYLCEAYKIGAAVVPDWFEEAVFKDLLVPYNTPGSMTIAGFILRHPDGDIKIPIGDYIINTNTDPTVLGDLTTLDAETFETNYLLDEAELVSVGTVVDSTVTGLGTVASPILWAIAVANDKTAIAAADILVSTDATKSICTDATFETADADQSIDLVAGTPADIFIKVTSKHGTLIKYYKVTVTRAAE
jgi:hypothetical protein